MCEAFKRTDGMIVELGCGTANGAIAALRLGASYIGIDKDGDCLNEAMRRVRWFAHAQGANGTLLMLL